MTQLAGVNLINKKCRYCGKQATQAEEVTQHAFPFTGKTHTVILYLCDEPLIGNCRKENRDRLKSSGG